MLKVIQWAQKQQQKYPVSCDGAHMFVFLIGIDQTLVRLLLRILFAVNVIFLYTFNLKSSLFCIWTSSGVEEARKLTKDQEQHKYTNRSGGSILVNQGHTYSVISALAVAITL